MLDTLSLHIYIRIFKCALIIQMSLGHHLHCNDVKLLFFIIKHNEWCHSVSDHVDSLRTPDVENVLMVEFNLICHDVEPCQVPYDLSCCVLDDVY